MTEQYFVSISKKLGYPPIKSSTAWTFWNGLVKYFANMIVRNFTSLPRNAVKAKIRLLITACYCLEWHAVLYHAVQTWRVTRGCPASVWNRYVEIFFVEISKLILRKNTGTNKISLTVVYLYNLSVPVNVHFNKIGLARWSFRFNGRTRSESFL